MQRVLDEQQQQQQQHDERDDDSNGRPALTSEVHVEKEDVLQPTLDSLVDSRSHDEARAEPVLEPKLPGSFLSRPTSPVAAEKTHVEPAPTMATRGIPPPSQAHTRPQSPPPEQEREQKQEPYQQPQTPLPLRKPVSIPDPNFKHSTQVSPVEYVKPVEDVRSVKNVPPSSAQVTTTTTITLTTIDNGAATGDPRETQGPARLDESASASGLVHFQSRARVDMEARSRVRSEEKRRVMGSFEEKDTYTQKDWEYFRIWQREDVRRKVAERQKKKGKMSL